MRTAPSVLVHPLASVPAPSDDILSELILSIRDYDRGCASTANCGSRNNELKLLIVAERTRQSFVSTNVSHNRSSAAEWFPQDDVVRRPTTNRTLDSFAGCTVVITTKRIVNAGKEPATKAGTLRIPVHQDGAPVLLDMYTSDMFKPPPTITTIASVKATSSFPSNRPKPNPARPGHPSAPLNFEQDPSWSLLEYASMSARTTLLKGHLPSRLQHTQFLQLVESTVDAVRVRKTRPACAGSFEANDACEISSLEFQTAASEMQHALFGPIADANVTEFHVARGHESSGCCEVPMCPSTHFENIVAFPGYYPGRVARLVHEVNYGGGAILTSDLKSFATPVSQETPITIGSGSSSSDAAAQRNVVRFHPLIFGSDSSISGHAQVNRSRVSSGPSFTPGQRVLFRGFSHASNNGMFYIIAVGPGPTIRIADLPPSEFTAGRSELLEYEASTSGATLEGCFGHTVGPSMPLRAITVYGRTSAKHHWDGGDKVEDAFGENVVCFNHGQHKHEENDIGPAHTVNPFVDGELVRLHGFERPGNLGVFRARIVAAMRRSCIGLADINTCATNVGCPGKMAYVHGAGPPIEDSLLPIITGNLTRDHFECIPRKDVRFAGGEIVLPGGSNILLSHAACCDSCHSTPGCSGWSFRKSLDPDSRHGECTLYRVAYEITAEHDMKYDSGTLLSRPDCGGPPPCSRHGICGRHGCVCDATWGGAYCQDADLPCAHNCSGHGVCDTLTGSCDCFPSFGGIVCADSVIPCPKLCSGHGTCVTETGACRCDPTWGGLDCGHIKLPCPKDCCGHGKCEATQGGTCICKLGWGVASHCCERTCTSDCSLHGVCDDSTQTCVCEHAWTGDNCERSIVPCPSALKIVLPNQMQSVSKSSHTAIELKGIVAAAESIECSGHGACNRDTGKCSCEDSWSTIDCAVRDLQCPTSVSNISCSGHGTCDATVGVCECDLMWCGEDCGHRCSRCPGDPQCGGEGHGFCSPSSGMCQCYRAWEDADCSQPKCGEHGVMLPDGSCRCDPDWYSAVKGGICDRVGRLCRCDIACVADKSPLDTCSSSAVGCSNVGACQCTENRMGVVCQQLIEPTGEQNKKNFVPSNPNGGLLSDTAMDLRKAVFLTYLGARAPTNEELTLEDILAVFQMHGMASESQGQLRVMAKHAFDAGTMCMRPHSETTESLKYNEFMQALSSDDPSVSLIIPRAIRYVYLSLDQDADGFVSFHDVAMSLVKRDCLRSLNSKPSKKKAKKKKKGTQTDHIVNVAGTKLDGTWTLLHGKSQLLSTIDVASMDLGPKHFGGDIVRVAAQGATTLPSSKASKPPGENVYFYTLSSSGKITDVDRPWTGGTSVGRELYIFTNEDMLECAGGNREHLKTLEEFTPTYISPLGSSFRYVTDIWRETAKLWSAMRPPQLGDTTGQIAFVRLDLFEKTAMRQPFILASLSVHSALVSQPDPGAKKWCEDFQDCSHPDLGSICAPEAPQAWSEQMFYVGVLLRLRRDLAFLYEDHRSGKRLITSLDRFDHDLTEAKNNVVAESEDLSDVQEAFDNLRTEADTAQFNKLAEVLHNTLWHAQAKKVQVEARGGGVTAGGSAANSEDGSDSGYGDDESAHGGRGNDGSEKNGGDESGGGGEGDGSGGASTNGRTGCRGPGCDGVGQGTMTDLGGSRRGGGGAGGGGPGDMKITGGGLDISDGGGGDGQMPGSGGDFDISSEETVFPPDTFSIVVKSKVSWCDMTDPFENPFCPTPNPMFNILIKMMILGLIQPVVDMLIAKMMGGMDMILQIAAFVFPVAGAAGPMGNPFLFTELEETIGVSNRVKGGGGGGAAGTMVKSLYESTVGPMTSGIFKGMNPLLRESLASRLGNNLATKLRPVLTSSITHAITHSLGNTVPIALAQSVSLILERMLPRMLHKALLPALSQALTRSLTHSVTPSVIATLSMTASERASCFQCEQSRDFKACEMCPKKRLKSERLGIQRGHFDAAYYSDYFGEYFTNDYLGGVGGHRGKPLTGPKKDHRPEFGSSLEERHKATPRL